MATINHDAIDTFMSITGASEPVAIQRLNESGGNLNEAVNAHFSEGAVNAVQEAPVTVTAPLDDDVMDIDDPPGLEAHDSSSLLSATGGLNPFSLLDSSFRRGLLGTNFSDSGSELMGRTHTPIVSQPREVREIPIEVRDGHDTIMVHSGPGPRIEDVTDTIDGEGPGISGTVIVDDDDEVIPVNSQNNTVDTRPSAPEFDVDIEEEMIRAAIEASKRDAQLQNKDSSIDVGPQHSESDIAHDVSLSLRTVEQENMQRNQTLLAGASGSGADMPLKAEELEIGEPHQSHNVSSLSQERKETGSSSILDEADELNEQPLVRRRSSRRSSGSMEAEREVGETEAGPPLSPSGRSVGGQIHPNGSSFPAEWGGISSEEHDEAVMLEAAMFGGIPESGYQIPHAVHPHMRPVFDAAWTAPRPASPSVIAQRAIREQQDDEYLASLQADREKEMRAMEEEKAAREAALEEERRKELEAQRELEEEQELERQLAGKQASLPEEPSLDDENAVALLIRMPDGGRHGRRFRKSDKLQSLFDFLDVGRVVKPGTYRVVRPYPRQAFSDGQCNLTLNELGLTSKQEALFLELI